MWISSLSSELRYAPLMSVPSLSRLRDAAMLTTPRGVLQVRRFRRSLDRAAARSLARQVGTCTCRFDRSCRV